MHIKNIHSMIEKLSECAKCELDKGIDNIDAKEMGEVAEMIKELCEAEYYAKITKAMEESAEEEGGERKYYRGQPRDSRGRYMSGRRGYEEPMMDFVPEMYRDMDLMDGKMYYTSANRSQGSQGGSMNDGGMRNYGGSMGGSSGGSSQGSSRGYSENMRDGREGRNGQSRKSYMETKEMHRGNTEEDKQAKKRELDKWMSDFSADVKELVGDMTPEEKTLLKTKIGNLHSSL